MNIAVLIYGRLNFCVENYESIINSIGTKNNIDFFLSSDNSSEILLNNFINLYKPVNYINDKIIPDIDLSKYPIPANYYTEPQQEVEKMICHFINKGRVFLLLEKHIQKENIHYDVIISLRIDLHFHNNFDFSNIEDNTIYIPAGDDFQITHHEAINDRIAYGNFFVMQKYSSIYSNLINILETTNCYIHPETLTSQNIKFNNLNVKRVNLHSHIVR